VRVAIVELKQETNTFVPRPTTLADFEAWHLWRGQELITKSANTNVEVAGFLDVLEGAGIEIVPIIATFAMSGGRVVSGDYELLLQELIDGLRKHGPFDGVLLALHGAMVTDDDDDPDGRTIAAVRDLIGPDVPLVVTMDLHANVTKLNAIKCDAIVGFKTSPHIDQRDTGQRGAKIMLKILLEGARPRMSFLKIPMVVPASTHIHHLPGPFKRLMDATKAAETGDLLSASVFAVQPWLDIDEMGFAVVTVADDDQSLADRVAQDFAIASWAERHEFMKTELVLPEEAIARALAAPEGPIVLSDLADGTGAGSPGDATAVVKALLVADLTEPAFVCIRDPEAANAAIAAGVGNTVSLVAGGKLDHVYNTPVELTGDVTFAGPAKFRFSGQGYTGVEMDMGDCAVVRCGQVHVLLLGTVVMTVDPAMYRAVGLEPLDARIVVVKSAIQFRAGYDGIAQGIILLDSPGMSSDHLESLPFTKLQPPFFPFDREFAWHPE
jgi:microcystin degradation protein MlrC